MSASASARSARSPSRPFPARNPSPSRTVTAVTDSRIAVQATGRVRVRPDLARVHVTCLVKRPAAALAFDDCSEATRSVLAALGAAQIADGDLATSGIDLSRQHDDGSYVATNSLVVVVRPPERVGAVLRAAVEAGGDAVSIGRLDFDIADRHDAESDARTHAVQQARRKAEQLATAARVALGPLLLLSEGGMQSEPSRRVRAAAAFSGGPPVEVGEHTIAVTVTAEFEIAGHSRT
jgi:uncharacterized protein YggE